MHRRLPDTDGVFSHKWFRSMSIASSGDRNRNCRRRDIARTPKQRDESSGSRTIARIAEAALEASNISRIRNKWLVGIQKQPCSNTRASGAIARTTRKRHKPSGRRPNQSTCASGDSPNTHKHKGKMRLSARCKHKHAWLTLAARHAFLPISFQNILR